MHLCQNPRPNLNLALWALRCWLRNNLLGGGLDTLFLAALFTLIISLSSSTFAIQQDLAKLPHTNSTDRSSEDTGNSDHTGDGGSKEIISDIFIEATGNNKYEAKIKAHQQGMQRAVILLADKMGIDINSLTPIPYGRLKNVFEIVSINDEVSQKEKYSANISYRYPLGKFYKLLLDYGDAKINDMFYEYLVIPVFKQGSFLNVWNPDKRWNNFWVESRKLLEAHKLYYPEKSLFLTKKITEENVLQLTYEEFVDVFKNNLFKGVLIVTAEFLTDRNTRESIIRVITYARHADGAADDIFEKDYPLNAIDDIGYTVDLVMDKMIDDFGMLRSHPDIEYEDESNLLPEEESKTRSIVMLFDVYDPDELQIVQDKLEAVEQISSFKMYHDYNNRYKIILYTNVGEFELAEGLYLNGLSYKIYGNLYHLIDVKKGV